MNGLVRKSVTMTAMAVMTVIGGAGLAQAQDNCDSYAKLTLQQAKQNLKKGCKFEGARWSLDADKHRAWCKDVGPTEWRDELKARSEKLSGCKG